MYSKTKKSNVFVALTSITVIASMSVFSGFATGVTTKLDDNQFQQIIENSKSNIDQLNDKLSKLEEVNKLLLVNYKETKDKFDKANEELTRLKAEKSALEQQHSALMKQCQKQAAKGISSEAEKQEMEKIAQQIKDLVKQIDPQVIRCESAEKKYEPINKKYQEVNETINSVRTKIEETQSEQTKMVEREKEFSDLITQHNEVKNEYDQEKEKVQNLEVKANESKEKLAKAESDEKAKLEECKTIVKQMNKMKSELHTLMLNHQCKAHEVWIAGNYTLNARAESVQVEAELQEEIAKSDEVKSKLNSVETKLSEVKEQFDAQCQVVVQKCVETKSTAIAIQEKLEADKMS